MTLSKMASTVF